MRLVQASRQYVSPHRSIGRLEQCHRGFLNRNFPSALLVIHEPSRQRARDLANTPGFPSAQRERKKVEALFAERKNQIGLRRLRLRRLKFVREQFFMAAAAQNIKRLVRFLSQGPQPPPCNDLVPRTARNSSSPRCSHPLTSDFTQPFFNTHA